MNLLNISYANIANDAVDGEETSALITCCYAQETIDGLTNKRSFSENEILENVIQYTTCALLKP